jgi:hypothetical protein
MIRLPILRLLSASTAALVLVTGSAGAATYGPARVTDFDRQENGASVNVTFSLKCAPHGPETNTYFSLTLWQGRASTGNYVLASGGIQAPPSIIVCDNTRRSYTFNVRPSGPYADERFRVGTATTEWTVVTCTMVTPDTTECTGTELVRQKVRIHA